MTERQASLDGLEFTGHYSHNKEDMKLRAKELRDKGFCAVVVNTPTNRLSRGSRAMGYSVYAEAAVRIHDSWERNCEYLKGSQDRIDALRKKHKIEMDVLVDEIRQTTEITAEQFEELRKLGKV